MSQFVLRTPYLILSNSTNYEYLQQLPAATEEASLTKADGSTNLWAEMKYLEKNFEGPHVHLAK